MQYLLIKDDWIQQPIILIRTKKEALSTAKRIARESEIVLRVFKVPEDTFSECEPEMVWSNG